MGDREVAAMLKLLEWGASRAEPPQRPRIVSPKNMLEAGMTGESVARSLRLAFAMDHDQEASGEESEQE